ncbi:MAG: GNAT family protein [Dehalococcoidia bacterium]
MKLIPFSHSHFSELASWFSCERDVVQWGGTLVSFPLDISQLKVMLDEGVGCSPARICWMAESKGILVGHAQLGIDYRNGNATLSRVAVKPSVRGQGLTNSMLSLVIDEAFAIPGVLRVELNVYDWNTPAIKVYERLGFVREGLRRSSARVADERWNTAIMGILRDDWR